MVDHDVDADVAKFVRRATVEGIDSDSATTVGWLKMLDDGLDDVHLEHTASVLLAHRARGAEVINYVIMDPVAREEPVKVSSGLSDTTVLAVNHMRLQ